MKPLKYSEVYVLKISKQQKQTLNKIKNKGFIVSQFVRDAIKEKIEKDYKEFIVKHKKSDCPF